LFAEDEAAVEFRRWYPFLAAFPFLIMERQTIVAPPTRSSTDLAREIRLFARLNRLLGRIAPRTSPYAAHVV
jgi:hypothetical protein